MSLSVMLPSWPWLVTGALTGFVAYCNMPLHWKGSPDKATMDWLAGAPLKRLDKSESSLTGADLWQKNGAVIMAEAQALSTLKEHFEAKNVSLYGLLHEELGAQEFKKYFKGELLLDQERRFYGPEERRMLLTGMLRWSVWSNIMRANKKGVEGNFKGDGTLLGSVFVLGPGDQGILYEHREMEFGDQYDSTLLLEAVNKVKSATEETVE